MEKTGKQLYQEVKNKLIENKLIFQDFIESTFIQIKEKDEIKQINLTPYFEDYIKRLSQVPTYVSDNSYVLKKVNQIKDLIEYLKSVFPQNSYSLQQISSKNYQFNENQKQDIQRQLLSKQFSQCFNHCKLVRYIYYQVCGQWLKENVNSKVKYQEFLFCEIKQDEGFFSHNVRNLGAMINQAFLINKNNK